MFVEVEPCSNVDKQFSMRYNTVSRPKQVYCIKYDRGKGEVPVQVIGWDARCNQPCPAYVCDIEESGDGMALLIFGGSGGLRFKELEDESEWNPQNRSQWSETHLVYPKDSFFVLTENI